MTERMYCVYHVMDGSTSRNSRSIAGRDILFEDTMLGATAIVSAKPQSREYHRDLAFQRFPLDLGWESKIVYIRRGEARIGSQVILADFNT